MRAAATVASGGVTKVGTPLRLDPECRTNQLHVDLHGGGLGDMVADLADLCLATLGPAVHGRPGPARDAIRKALAAALRGHVVGFDICGLGAICRDAEAFSPWDQDPSG